MPKIVEILKKEIWEDFLNNEEIVFYPLFQSWNWGEVQKLLGFQIFRFGLYSQTGILIGVFQIVSINAKRGRYLHIRHGPVLLEYSEKNFHEIIIYLKIFAQEHHASFIRISPLIEKNNPANSQFQKFINAPMHNMDAEICWILDITISEEELLKNMRKTHRYLIKRAKAMNIETVRTQNVSDIDIFLSLYKNLSKRKHFVPHKGVKEEFEIFSKNDETVLLLAKFDKKIVAGALVLFVRDMAIYHHGASLEEYRNIPASYLLQWEAILEAKKRNKRIYNFWGIAPEGEKNHPWAGLTLFKMGFGGEKKEFIHAKDLPLSFSYWKTYGIEMTIKKLKGY